MELGGCLWIRQGLRANNVCNVLSSVLLLLLLLLENTNFYSILLKTFVSIKMNNVYVAYINPIQQPLHV